MMRITPEQAEEVRAMAASGSTYRELAHQYNVREEAIGRIVRRESFSRHTIIPSATISVVKKRLAEGDKHDSIAFDLGLSRSYVTHIANGKRRVNG